MELNYVLLGERIRNRRRQTNIKQNVLAERLEISNNYLSGIERGREKPSLEILVKICNALEITPDYLLMGCMHSNNVPQSITEGLRLCSPEDIDLIKTMVQYMVSKNETKWNHDNFV
jgi:transcriptional regulator with XRE-family HTH domain